MPILVLSVLLLITNYSFAMTVDELLGEQLQTGDKIELTAILPGKSHQVILSAPKRINNELVVEKDKLITGTHIRALIKFASLRNLEGFAKYIEGLLSSGGSISYQCQQRNCGVNTYWSNDLLNERRLSGRDSDQAYVVGALKIDGASYWLSVYMVTNSLRENLALVTLIEDKGKETWVNGLLIPDSKIIEQASLLSLKEKLQTNQALTLYVVAYSDVNTLPLIKDSQNRADSELLELKSLLTKELNVSADKIKTYFVGPFHTQASVGNAGIWFRLFIL